MLNVCKRIFAMVLSGPNGLPMPVVSKKKRLGLPMCPMKGERGESGGGRERRREEGEREREGIREARRK